MAKDMTNLRFGKLIVLNRDGSDRFGNRLYMCQCDCGGIKKINGASLRMGSSTSCGYCVHENMLGKKFTRLLVVEKGKTEKTKNGTNIWYTCVCDCGTKKEISGRVLRSEAIKSCGCLNLENHIKHGLSNTPEWKRWRGMRRRCYDMKNKNYKNYGAKGIVVCEEWLGEEGFINFYNHLKETIGLCPGPRYTLDRIDGTKNYVPGNIRWATSTEQNLNKLKTKGSSKYRGVYWDKKSNKWRATFQYANGKSIYCGLFEKEKDASEAFLEKYYNHYKKFPPEHGT